MLLNRSKDELKEYYRQIFEPRLSPGANYDAVMFLATKASINCKIHIHSRLA